MYSVYEYNLGVLQGTLRQIYGKMEDHWLESHQREDWMNRG